ncbi:nuclear transport factor 2 family protein [Sphingomonas sp. ID0503]|uniref:nuclear transport factor 2 family protein n=1 Tax=Sphingomonas sp. ID0503 TaxID=3399691 RepID=UPI003AFA6926
MDADLRQHDDVQELMMLLATLLAIASPDKLPPGEPVPPPASEEAAVLAPVNAVFAALAARDGQAALAQVDMRGNVTSVDASGKAVTRSWAEWAAGLKPGPQRYEERMPNPAVEIDGDVAMVWGFYTFAIDGKLHHCGADHFSLVRADGRWKVLNLAWSSRTEGCGS